MSPAAITKLKRKYKLTDNDLMSCMAYIVSDNKIYSWKNGAGMHSEAKNGSISVIASRYFQAQNVIECVYEIRDTIEATTTRNIVVPSDNEKEKEIDLENNKEVLRAGMSKSETINVLNNLAKRVKDPKQLADITLKISSLLEFATTTDSELKPIIYLPQRCEQCPHKPKE
jgi:hypothetical protein